MALTIFIIQTTKTEKKWAKYLTQELGGKKDYRRNPKKKIIKDRNKINNKSVLN